MNKTLFRSALVAGLASAASLAAAPAHAQFTGCGASSTSAMIMFSTLVSGGGQSCLVGDKLYSDFVFTIGTTDPNASITLGNPSFAPEQHTLVGSSTGWNTAGTFSYKVTVSGSPLLIKGINYDSQSSLFNKGYSWTANTPELGASATMTQSSTSAGPFMGGPTSVINVSHSLTNTGDPMQSWTDTIVQTPGPLPILGAGAAFGFSRKLRRRIKASA